MRIRTKHAKNLKLSTRYATLLKQPIQCKTQKHRKHAKHAKSVNMQKIQKKGQKIKKSEKVYKKK